MTTTTAIRYAIAIPTSHEAAAPSSPMNSTDLMPPSNMDRMMNSGDVASMIAAMLIKNATASRETARMSKKAALAAEDAANQKKLEHMRAAATERLVGGLAGGGATVVSGGLSIAGAVTNSNSTQLSGWTGSAKTAEGSGSGVKAVFDFMASDSDQEVAAEEQRGKVAGRAITAAEDQDKDAADLTRKALDYYKEYVSAKDQARGAAIHRA